MKQYRDLAKDPHAKERTYRRADSESQEEKLAQSSILQLLSLALILFAVI